MSLLPPFDLHRPDTLEEALSVISPDDVPYCGGTELLLAMRQRLIRPRSLVSTRAIPELASIEVSNTGITVGAAVTHRRAAGHEGAHAALPIIRQVLRTVGNPRVQSSGTLGGNLCFSEPKSDVIPLLAALESTLELHRADGTRREVGVEDFVVGPYTTILEPDELLISIRIPVVPGRETAYVKLQTMERPTVGVAAARFAANPISRVRLVVGAVGTGLTIVDGPADSLDPDRVADLVEPTSDLTGSADYKRFVTSVFVRRALGQLGQ